MTFAGMAISGFSLLFRRILKFFGITMAILLLLIGIASWILYKKGNDWILNRIQAYVNESQSGQLEIGSIDLEILSSLPQVDIVLNGINYYEHTNALRIPGEQPILHAEQLFISVAFLPLLREELNVSEINLSKAKVHLIQYPNGVMNIDLALAPPPNKNIKPDSSKHKPSIQIDLEDIQVSNVLVIWDTELNQDSIAIQIGELAARLSKNDSTIDIKLNVSSAVQAAYINRAHLPAADLNVEADLHLNKELKQWTIGSSKLNYDVFAASIQGTYEYAGNRNMDLDIDASSNDLALLSKLIKPEVIKKNPGLLQQGDIYFRGKLFGHLKTQPLQFNISFGVKDLALQLPKKMGICKDIGFEGSMVSGNKADYSEAKINIGNLRGQFPGGFLRGQFIVKNLVEPYLKYTLDAQLKLDGYDEVFQMSALKHLGGIVSLQARFDGLLKDIGKHQPDSNRSSIINLNNLTFVWTKTNQMVSGLSGRIVNSNNQSVIKDLGFTYGKNKLLLNATIDNFTNLLWERNSDLKASGNVHADSLFTKDFVLDTLLEANIQDRISDLSFDFQIARSAEHDNHLGNLSFNIRNLSARFGKLPDIKKINVRGQLGQTARGLKLDVQELQAVMPQGSLDMTGDLLMGEKRLLEFNAMVHAKKFPWTYVMELVTEIRSGPGATKKNIDVEDMEIFTTDLDLSATVTAWPFDIHSLVVRNSPVQVILPGSQSISVEKLNIDLQPLQFTHPQNSGAITGVASTGGTVEFKRLKVPGVQNKVDIALKIKGEENLLDMEFSSLTQQAKSEKGHLILDISKNEPTFHLNYAVTDANLESLIHKFYKHKLMEGTIDYAFDVTTKGSDWTKIQHNLTGDLEIRGDSLRLYGVDIDNVLKKFNKSQNFNLTDVGAVLVAGPVGLAVTKGSDFVSLASISTDSTQQTMIKTLLAGWRIENRMLYTKDFAFATSLNRVAFDGQIDLAHDSIPGFVIAVVDKNGCSLMDQKLYGKIGKLNRGKLNITKTLLGSVTNFVNAVVGKNCKPVYTGSVKDPLH